MPKKKPRPPAPELEDLHLRIELARAMRGMTKKALAAEAEIDQSQVTRLKDHAAGIEAATLLRLAKALGQPVGWIIAGEGAPVPVKPIPGASDRRRRATRNRKPGGD